MGFSHSLGIFKEDEIFTRQCFLIFDGPESPLLISLKNSVLTMLMDSDCNGAYGGYLIIGGV